MSAPATGVQEWRDIPWPKPRAACPQAPEADLSSFPAGRDENSSQAATVIDEFLVANAGRPSGATQDNQGKNHSWDRWRCLPSNLMSDWTGLPASIWMPGHNQSVESGFPSPEPMNNGPSAFPPWRIEHDKLWSNSHWNPNGKPSSSPTATDFDQADPATMRSWPSLKASSNAPSMCSMPTLPNASTASTKKPC